MKKFIEWVLPFRDEFIKVKIHYYDKNKIQKAVLKSFKLQNLYELRDMYEGAAFYDNFSRKILGALALEKLLKIKLVGWKEIKPKKYKADMSNTGLDIDIITCEYGEFPAINKNVKRPAVIAIKKDERNIWICGLADIDTLRKYQNDNFSKELIQRGTKTVFTGFKQLISFKNLDELKNHLKNNNKDKI